MIANGFILASLTLIKYIITYAHTFLYNTFVNSRYIIKLYKMLMHFEISYSYRLFYER